MKTMFKNALIVAGAAAVCALLPSEIAAQTLAPPQQRPMPGLFGRARGGDGVDLSVRTFEAYDDDLTEHGASPTVVGQPVQQSGMFEGLDLSFSAKRKLRHLSFAGNGESAVRYYPSLGNITGARHDFSGGITGQFDATQFSATQTVSYAPYFTYWPLPQAFEAQPAEGVVSTAHLLVRRPALITSSSGALSHNVGRRWTFSAAGSTQLTDYHEEAGNRFRADTASAGLLYHLTRDLGIVARYELQRGVYDLPLLPRQIAEFHNIVLGLDYDHALSLTRRTTVGFATGTAVFHDFSGSSLYRVIGDARISREMGRSWIATGSYHRGAGLLAGFSQPIFSDAVQTGVTGLLAPRLSFWGGAGFSTGEMLSLSGGGNHTDTYTASTRLQYAVSRIVALSGEYDYFFYRFDRLDGLPQGLPLQLGRNSARFGVTLWLPILR